MGGARSRPTSRGDGDDDCFLTMLDCDMLVACLGEGDVLRNFSGRFAQSHTMDIRPSVAMMVVLSGQIVASLVHNGEKNRMRTYNRGDIVPFFLHGKNYHPTAVSEDGSTLYLSPSISLQFDLKVAGPSRGKSARGKTDAASHSSMRSESRAGSSVSRSLFTGKVASISRQELELFLNAHPNLVSFQRLCSTKLAPLLMQSHEMLVTDSLWADIICPLVSLRMVMEGDLLCFPDTAAVATNVNSLQYEVDYSKQAGMLLHGSLCSINYTDDVIELLDQLDETHRSKGSYRGNIKSRRFIKTLSSKSIDMSWEGHGREIKPGAVVGVQNTFLHPKRTFDAVFASKHSLMAYISPLTVEGLQNVNSAMIGMWKVAFCSTFLTEVKSNGKPILKNIPDFGIQFWAARTTLLTHMKGDIVAKQGSAPETFFFIVDGEMEEAIRGHTDRRPLLHGDHYGASSIVTNKPYRGDFQAVTKATIMAIPAATFLQIVSKDAKVIIDIKLRAAGGDTDLIHVLRHPSGYAQFLAFLQASFCAENILFWRAVDDWDEACNDFRASSGDIACPSLSPSMLAQFSHDATTATATLLSSETTATLVLGEREEDRLRDEDSKGVVGVLGDNSKPSSRPPSHASNSRPSSSASNSTHPPARRESIDRLPPLHAVHWQKLAALREKCKSIIDKFCAMNSDECVNISHALRISIEKQFRAWCDWESKQTPPAFNPRNTPLTPTPNPNPETVDSDSDTSLHLVATPFETTLLQLFLPAQREVYELMRKDSFSRFKTTKQFGAFLQSLQEENAITKKARKGEDVERLRAYMTSYARDSPVGVLQ